MALILAPPPDPYSWSDGSPSGAPDPDCTIPAAFRAAFADGAGLDPDREPRLSLRREDVRFACEWWQPD